MRHVKIQSAGDVDKAQFTAWVQEAERLNTAQGDPTKAR
jgi:hypothetical protein